jgi:outer membrane protein OmpA-like peptidoglycan-associated protein
MNLQSKSSGQLRAGLSRALPVLAAAGFCAAAQAAAPATERNFVACPIVLDTPDVPCWVAEYQGERYFLAVQTGRSAGVTFVPQLKHRVLVEGTAHPDQPRMCGGIVLSPVKLSVFPDVEPDCGKMLPGDGFTVKSPRPIGPDGDPPGGKTTAVRVQRPGTLTRAQSEAQARADAAAGKPREFEILYFFGSNYLPFPVEQASVDQAADYFASTNGSKVVITGYRGEALLSNGKKLVQEQPLAQQRAEKVASILANFGVPHDRMDVRWVDVPQNNAGVLDWTKRRVTVVVTPSGPSTKPVRPAGSPASEEGG